jgi:hypothetical protein
MSDIIASKDCCGHPPILKRLIIGDENEAYSAAESDHDLIQ